VLLTLQAVIRPGNAILARLDRADYRRLSRYLEPLSLRFGQTVHEPQEAIEYVYLPYSGGVSMVMVLDGNEMIETSIVGHEGMVGLAVFLGMPSAAIRAVCQVAGAGMRLKAEVLQRERRRGGSLNELLLRYTYAVLAMTAQGAACNRAHSVEERLSRWLLMTHDRIHGDELALTQRFLAMMLGVHRPSVNLAGAALQNAGLIRYTRGRITITDRAGLERASCECYGKISSEFARALAT
jgi:CRP-like cAMP-binding protein